MFHDSYFGYAIDGFVARSDPGAAGGCFAASRSARPRRLKVMLGYGTLGKAGATAGASLRGQIHVTPTFSLSP